MATNSRITVELIRQARKKKVLIKVLSVYADDSSDGKGERIFAIAGVIGTQEQWDSLEVKWVARTGAIIFHATDCESDRGVYKFIPHEQNQELYKDLTQILARSGLAGYGVVMDIGAYKTFLPDTYSESPYLFCFYRVIAHFAKALFKFDNTQKIRFTFDNNHKVKYNAAYLYNNVLVTCKDWEFCSCLEDEIAFATRKTVGIQVADLFAKEIMKHIDNQFGPVKRPVRKSFIELKNTGRFFFEYYPEQWFEGFSQDLPSLQKLYGMEQEKIYEWLSKHKKKKATGEDLVNFIIELDSKESTDS